MYRMTLWHINFLLSVFMQAEDHKTFRDQNVCICTLPPTSLFAHAHDG